MKDYENLIKNYLEEQQKGKKEGEESVASPASKRKSSLQSIYEANIEIMEEWSFKELISKSLLIVSTFTTHLNVQIYLDLILFFNFGDFQLIRLEENKLQVYVGI